MPGWEDAKRATQSAYLNIGNAYQDIHSSISNAYQQILVNGQISSPANGIANYSQRIAEESYGLSPEYAAMDRLYQAQEIERERNEAILRDLEPGG